MGETPWLLKVGGRWIEVSDADLREGVEIAAKDTGRPLLTTDEAMNLLLAQGRLKRNPRGNA